MLPALILLHALSRDPASALADLESRSKGRIGLSVLDTGTGKRLEHRSGEHFPMCSTFKVLLVGAVLAKVDEGSVRLDQKLPLRKADLLAHAPVCRERLKDGALSLSDLCIASLEWSDNTAANLLIRFLGGPKAVTTFARKLGDPKTRLDRLEPLLNDWTPGDPRDTTTPEAMRADLQELLCGRTLSEASRKRLCQWMARSETGSRRLRAGLPSQWQVIGKTGTGDGITNDIAMITRPGRAPIFVAAYLADSKAEFPVRESILADLGRWIGEVMEQ